jgi:hypothetical protein
MVDNDELSAKNKQRQGQRPHQRVKISLGFQKQVRLSNKKLNEYPMGLYDYSTIAFKCQKICLDTTNDRPDDRETAVTRPWARKGPRGIHQHLWFAARRQVLLGWRLTIQRFVLWRALASSRFGAPYSSAIR